jgi:competence protein ComEA
MLKATVWGQLFIGFFLGVIVGVVALTMLKKVQPAPIVIVPPAPTLTPAPTETPGPLRIYVNGQVVTPAVYSLPVGSIVQGAVEAAGGFTAIADTAVVNLAQPLTDGMQIYVPAKGEVVSVPVVVAAPGGATGEGSTAVGSNGLININTAAIEGLDALPGIGPSTAQKIIEHREVNGPFATIEGIMDVPGIGEAKFAQIKDLITVDN